MHLLLVKVKQDSRSEEEEKKKEKKYFLLGNLLKIKDFIL